MKVNATFSTRSGDTFPLLESGIQVADQFQMNLNDLCVKVVPSDDYVVELDGTPPERLLVEGDMYSRELKVSGRTLRHRKEQAGAAGDFVAVVRSRTGEEVARAVLRVRPANLTSEELQRMLFEIADLALTDVTRVWARGLCRHGDVVPDVGSLGLESLAACIGEWDKLWETVQRAPLRSHAMQWGDTSVARALRRPAGVRAVLERPGRVRVPGPQLVESNDCSENQWLYWALNRVILPTLRAHRETLNRLSPDSDSDVSWMLKRLDRAINEQGLVADSFRARLVNRPNRRDRSASVDALNLLISTAERMLAAEIFDGVGESLDEPPRTERLVGHPYYGSLVRSLDACFGNLSPTLSRAVAFVGRVRTGQVKATWRCYEIWCLLSLLDGFQRLAALAPAGDSDLWINRLQESDVGLTLSISRSNPVTYVRLVGSIRDRIRIAYEPEVPSSRGANGKPVEGSFRTLTPDYLFGVDRCELVPARVDGERARWQLVNQFYVVGDAKYRNYAQQESARVEDLWTVCRAKYLAGFREAHQAAAPMAISPRSVFVLHTDPDVHGKGEYWGEVPFHQWLKERSLDGEFDQHDIEDDWPDHSVALVRYRPDVRLDRVVSQMIDMWFGFYCRTDGTSDICPRCATRLAVGEDTRFDSAPGDDFTESKLIDLARRGRIKVRRPSLFNLCPACEFHWVENHCYHGQHALLKLGRRTMHAPSKQGYDPMWMYICPKCGSDPTPEELGMLRAKARDSNTEPAIEGSDDGRRVPFLTDDLPF